MEDQIENTPIARRGLLLGAAGAAGAAALTVAGADTAAAHHRSGSLVLDVAVRLSTFRVSLTDGSNDPGPLPFPRGSSFLLEGEIFEGGTATPGEVFQLDENLDRRIGNWFCWGNLIAITERPDPHVVSTQEYVFGPITTDNPFPPDKLISGGGEGTFDPSTNPQMRAVLGGSGVHAGARGHVAQFIIGQNTDRDPFDNNSPMLRFSFDVQTRRFASIKTLTRRAGLR